MRRNGKKKLAKLVLAALLSTGGVLFSFSALVYADAEITANDGTTYQDATVYGNHADGDYTTPEGLGSGNNVKMTGGTVGTIYGGQSGDSDASGNTINISGGTVTGNNGGYIFGGGGSTAASRNTINITGAPNLSNALIYCGMATSGADNNIINIYNLSAPLTVVHLLGGENTDGSATSGNTLNIASKDVSVEMLYGFQNINFYLTSGISSGDTMLTLTSDQYNLTGVTYGAAVAGASLSTGDTVNLITKADGLTTDETIKTTKLTTAPTATGLTVDTSYELEISKKDANTIIATVTGASKTQSKERVEQAKSLVETRAAATTYLNAGTDMLASQGFTQAANAVALDMAEQTNNGAAGAPATSAFTPFAAFGGSSMRAESGSHVNTRGYGLNIGFARELPNSQGKLLFGPVVEYGGGSYDSHLNDGTRGDGKAHYFGVGIMARQVNHNGFYYEGSVRGGRVTSDYRSVFDTIGKVDYDSSSNYIAAHLGVGKAFSLGGGNTLDGYLKYFYSHQAGDDTTVHIANAADERADFDSVNSHRIRLGARLTHKINDKNSLYGGLAYQYEFGSEARATFNGTGTPSPTMKGSSGMLELGWQVKPGGPLTLDLGVTGWAGKQRGGSVQLGATWTF